MGMHGVLYTRISQDATGERAGVSRQLDDCAMLAEKIGATIVGHFDDNDISAYNGKTRPGFEAMLKALERGDADTVICWHVDRLYRSMKDLERLIDIVDTNNIAIRTVNGGDLDLGNATGKMLARILASVSRQESEHKGERRRRANLQRAQAGAWRSDQPRIFGYTQRGELLEPEATAIRLAIHDVLGGRSLRSIAGDWNERGIATTRGQRWSNLTLRRALLRPVYAGLVVYQDKVMKGVTGEWQAIISEDTHRGLVAYLSDPSRRTATAFVRAHMGSGVYRCGVCGGLLYASFRGRRDRGMTYVCKPHIHVGRVGAPLDELVSVIVLERLRRSDIWSRLAPREQFDVAAMHAQRAALQARADELAAMFAAAEIDASQLRRGTADLRTRMAEIDQALADAIATGPAVQLLDGDLDELEKRWDACSPDIKGKIVDQLMTVTVLPTPRGVKGVDRDGVVNPDYIRIDWR